MADQAVAAEEDPAEDLEDQATDQATMTERRHLQAVRELQQQI